MLVYRSLRLLKSAVNAYFLSGLLAISINWAMSYFRPTPIANTVMFAALSWSAGPLTASFDLPEKHENKKRN